jgi:pimeloyl-ACP methyl ester carboxylesterase
LAKINLIGWSWGTTLMSRYTIENPTAVNKLVLIAPQWTRDTPSLADAGGLEGTEILPLMLMAPNGTVIDSREYWAAGKPLYKPERITCLS